MPRYQNRQHVTDTESQESFVGDAVPVDGVENQATRRAHMRALTTARQAAERHLGYPPIPYGYPDRHALIADRLAEVRVELTHINDDHRAWLHDQHEEGRSALSPAVPTTCRASEEPTQVREQDHSLHEEHGTMAEQEPTIREISRYWAGEALLISGVAEPITVTKAQAKMSDGTTVHLFTRTQHHPDLADAALIGLTEAAARALIAAAGLPREVRY